MDVYCSSQPQGGYNACNSKFFASNSRYPLHRAFRESTFLGAASESGLLTLLLNINSEMEEQARRETELESQRQQQETLALLHMCQTALAGAATTKEIDTLPERCTKDTPEDFVAQLTQQRGALHARECRTQARASDTVDDVDAVAKACTTELTPEETARLQVKRATLLKRGLDASVARLLKEGGAGEIDAFLSEHETELRTNPVVSQLRRLRDQRAQEQARSERAAKDGERRQQIEFEIITCQRRVDAAQDVIVTEQRIGQVSGYVDKMRLRQAGEVIVFCTDLVSRHYDEYKRLGGKQTLSTLR